MIIPHPSQSRGLGAPKSKNAGGLVAPKRLGEGAFTLLEIMIVVSIIALLSFLAMVAVAKVRDRAVRSIIANNLRQLYDAKAYYYSETGESQPASVDTLAQKGYITARLKAALSAPRSMESSQGWHYATSVVPNEPTLAYQGVLPAGGAPTGEALYYPNSPTGTPAATTPAQPPVQPVVTAAVPAQQPVQPLVPVPAFMRDGFVFPDQDMLNQMDGVDLSIFDADTLSAMGIAKASPEQIAAKQAADQAALAKQQAAAQAAADKQAADQVKAARIASMAVVGPPGSPVMLQSTPKVFGLTTQGYVGYSDQEILTNLVGGRSADGSPVTVVSLRSDPPGFITGVQRSQDGETSFNIARPGANDEATVYVTFRNSSGESTLPFTLRTGL